ncbi:MAG: sugar phosphate nucleotidyltransferase, partial [Vulcanimicrobiaceae bacterium]
HLIGYLRAAGITEIAINVHYLASRIEAALGDGSSFGVRLEYLYEEELLGSAGAVKQMEAFFGDEDFVVVGCDDLTDLSLDALLSVHAESGAYATIGLVERDEVDQYGVVVCDTNGRIIEFQEKPARGTERSHLVNTGIYAFSPDIFEFIPAAQFYDFGKQVFSDLLHRHAPFYGYDANDAYWCDIGTLREYRRATRDVLCGTLTLPDVRIGIHESALVHPDAQIEGPVLVAPHAQIHAGARIVGPTVIGSGATVGKNALVSESILWRGAHVGEHARLHDAIVGIDFRVADGTVLDGVAVADEATVAQS